MPSLHAILIGINTYEHSAVSDSDTGWKPLKCSENDVAAMRKAIQDLGWPQMRLQEFSGRTAQAATLKALIDNALLAAESDSLVLIYFAGHAILTANGRFYLAAYDTHPARPAATGISGADLRKWMDRSQAKDVVLILDCCYSGSLSAQPGDRNHAATAFRQWWAASANQSLPVKCSRYILASSWQGQLSRERPYTTDGHGVFTEYLIRALGNGNGKLDAEAVFNAIEAHMSADGAGQFPLREAWGSAAPVLRREGGEKVSGSNGSSNDGRAPRVVTATRRWSHEDRSGSLHACDLSPLGNPVVAATQTHQGVVIDLISGATGERDRTLCEMSGEDLVQLAISPNAASVAVLTVSTHAKQSRLRLLPLTHIEQTATITLGDVGGATRLAFTPDSQFAATYGLGGMRVWDAQGQERASFARETETLLRDLSFCPAKRRLVTIVAERQNKLYVWDIDAESSETRAARTRRAATFEEVAVDDEPWFTAMLDDKTVVWVSRTGRVELTQLAGGAPPITPLRLWNPPTTFACGPELDRFACGTTGGEVQIIVREPWGFGQSMRFASRISSVAFSPDPRSKLIAAGAANGEVRLWNFETGKIIQIDRTPTPGETFLRFSSNGQSLLVAHETGRIVEMWQLT